MATDDHEPGARPPPPPAPATYDRAAHDRATHDRATHGRTPDGPTPPPAPATDGRATDDGTTHDPPALPSTRVGGPRDVNRTGIVVAAVVGVLVLVALLTVVLQRDPAQLDLATPEGTVQAFLQSVVDGEPRDDLLDPTVDCAAPESRGDQDRVRAVVLDTAVDGDTATVELSVTESSGSDPFDDGYTRHVGYDLRRNGDGWVIAAYDWPWEYCWNDRMGLGS